MDDLLMGEEAAQVVGVSYKRLHQLTKEQGLGRRMSGHWVFTRQELEAYKAKEKDKGGRPKSIEDLTMENQTPMLEAA